MMSEQDDSGRHPAFRAVACSDSYLLC